MIEFNGSIDLYTMFPPSTALNINSSAAARMIRLRRKLMNTSIWSLLRETHRLACADRRDKVYAVLSIATEVADGVEADYLRALRELGLMVLSNYHDDKPPGYVYDVKRDCRVVERVLGVDPED